MERTLLDNDVVLKLGQYDLLDELLALTRGPESIRVLPTFRYRFRLDSPERAVKIIRDEKAVGRIRAFAARVRELEDAPPAELISLLEDTPQIDPGEVVLFAVAASDRASLTYTGDKRAIAALVATTGSRRVADQLRGRIKCLEQVVAEMLVNLDADTVVRKIRGKEWDRVVRICSSSGSAEETLIALQSYYAHLDSECGGLLAPFPRQN